MLTLTRLANLDVTPLRLPFANLRLTDNSMAGPSSSQAGTTERALSSIVLTLPIVAGKVEAWRRFCQELAGSRLQAYIGSRRRIGIMHERVELVETPFGSTAVNTIEAGDLSKVFAQIATSELPFDSWYRERLYELHGIALTAIEQFVQPTFTPSQQELVFEWEFKPKTRGEPRRRQEEQPQ